jgi:hypothetical protein
MRSERCTAAFASSRESGEVALAQAAGASAGLMQDRPGERPSQADTSERDGAAGVHHRSAAADASATGH